MVGVRNHESLSAELRRSIYGGWRLGFLVEHGKHGKNGRVNAKRCNLIRKDLAVLLKMCIFADNKVINMSFMHTLNEHTRKTLSRKLGKSYQEMLQMSAEELDALVEARIGKKLEPAFSLKNMVNRGSVYLFFQRLLTKNDIDKGIAKI